MEDSKSDKVKMATYKSYIQAAGGFCIFMVVLLLILITLSAQSFANYWLSVWLKAGSGVSVEREGVSAERKLLKCLDFKDLLPWLTGLIKKVVVEKKSKSSKAHKFHKILNMIKI